MTTAEFYASMTKAQLEHIFRSSSGVVSSVAGSSCLATSHVGRFLSRFLMWLFSSRYPCWTTG